MQEGRCSMAIRQRCAHRAAAGWAGCSAESVQRPKGAKGATGVTPLHLACFACPALSLPWHLCHPPQSCSEPHFQQRPGFYDCGTLLRPPHHPLSPLLYPPPRTHPPPSPQRAALLQRPGLHLCAQSGCGAELRGRPRLCDPQNLHRWGGGRLPQGWMHLCRGFNTAFHRAFGWNINCSQYSFLQSGKLH